MFHLYEVEGSLVMSRLYNNLIIIKKDNNLDNVHALHYEISRYV